MPVYLIGAGPGDPDLITLKAVKALNKADVVLYDYLANEEILKHAPEDAKRIYVGKKAGEHYKTQDEINQLIIEEAKEHDVPVHEDAKLANTLSKLDIGEYIPPELYEVVAEILVFVDNMERIRSKLSR